MYAGPTLVPAQICAGVPLTVAVPVVIGGHAPFTFGSLSAGGLPPLTTVPPVPISPPVPVPPAPLAPPIGMLPPLPLPPIGRAPPLPPLGGMPPLPGVGGV